MNGDLKAHLTAGGANAHASVGWEMGKFKWEAGGVVQLGGVTNHIGSKARSRPAPARAAAASLHNNGAITFGASAPETVKQITITSITGNVSGGAANVPPAPRGGGGDQQAHRAGCSDLHVDVGTTRR